VPLEHTNKTTTWHDLSVMPAFPHSFNVICRAHRKFCLKMRLSQGVDGGSRSSGARPHVRSTAEAPVAVDPLNYVQQTGGGLHARRRKGRERQRHARRNTKMLLNFAKCLPNAFCSPGAAAADR
jgi:hypothetical protein